MKTKIIPAGLINKFKRVWKKRTGQNIDDINRGWCYQFALILHKIHGNAVKICGTYQHVWIEFDGKHYDCDYKQGVKFPLCYEAFRYFKPKELADNWRWRGISGPVRWDIINEVADVYLPPKKKQNSKRKNVKVFFRLDKAA